MNPLITSPLYVLCLLIVGHFIADYPLQGDFLSKAKNKKNTIPGIPWWQAMIAHCVIHGGFVGIITGSVLLGIAETVLHFIIDYEKCDGQISYNEDQWMHILCKLAWWTIFTMCLMWFPNGNLLF